MLTLHTAQGIFPMDSLKDYGEYLVKTQGGRLLKHTEKVYIYENRMGTRYAIRMADENVALEYKQYYSQYNCQGVFVGIRRSAKVREKMKKGDVGLYMGQFSLPASGEKIVITPTNPRMKPVGYMM